MLATLLFAPGFKTSVIALAAESLSLDSQQRWRRPWESGTKLARQPSCMTHQSYGEPIESWRIRWPPFWDSCQWALSTACQYPVNASLSMCADDIAYWRAIRSDLDVVCAQSNLTMISNEIEAKNQRFNTKKTKMLLISRKRK